MTAIEKLKNLQAGELDKVLPEGNYNGIAGYIVQQSNEAGELVEVIKEIHWAKQNKLNAAKVEVAKVVVGEYLDAFNGFGKRRDSIDEDVKAGVRLMNALTLLQQLKESL
jgi:hypothetical protein